MTSKEKVKMTLRLSKRRSLVDPEAKDQAKENEEKDT